MENEMNKKVEEHKNERGLAAIEYVIMAALMIAAVVAAVGLFAPQLNNAFTNMGNKLETASQ
jgi:Flp pilus assembly pilin Flp